MENFRTKIPAPFNLPKRLGRLGEFVYNLWWSWHPEATRAIGRLDYDLWERLGHNPIRFFQEIGQERLEQAARDEDYLAIYDNIFSNFDSYFSTKETWAVHTHPELINRPIAYFSMEYGLHETLPIYSGGLGVLAGDHLKEASDLGLPLVGVGLMYAEGYFTQRINEDGWQETINNMLKYDDLPVLPVIEDGIRMTVDIEFPDHIVSLQIWEVRVGKVPLYLLDSNVDINSDADKNLTARLYLSDPDQRIMQEVL